MDCWREAFGCGIHFDRRWIEIGDQAVLLVIVLFPNQLIVIFRICQILTETAQLGTINSHHRQLNPYLSVDWSTSVVPSKYYRVPPGLYIWTSTILTVLAVSARDRSTGLPDSKSAQVIRSNSSWSSLYVRLRFSEIRYESCHTRKITPLDDHPLSSAISISGNSKIYGIPKYVLSICVFSIHLQRSGLGIQNSTKCVFPARSIISIRS